MRNSNAGIMAVTGDTLHLGVISGVINMKSPRPHCGLLAQHAGKSLREKPNSLYTREGDARVGTMFNIST
jgi:hypothetical protein